MVFYHGQTSGTIFGTTMVGTAVCSISIGAMEITRFWLLVCLFVNWCRKYVGLVFLMGSQYRREEISLNPMEACYVNDAESCYLPDYLRTLVYLLNNFSTAR